MALIQSGDSEHLVSVASNKALNTQALPRAVTGAYKLSGITGTIAAALAQDSSVFVMRLSPSSGLAALIERIHLKVSVIAAFSAAITAGRRLALYRGSGAAASGGTALAAMTKADSPHPASKFDSGQGGDVRFATTAALTVAGITFETNPFLKMVLTGDGAAGATRASPRSSPSAAHAS